MIKESQAAAALLAMQRMVGNNALQLIFPTLGINLGYRGPRRNATSTKKGPGRFHRQG